MQSKIMPMASLTIYSEVIMTKSYESPFSTRYASDEMQHLFSADKKFTTWRRLWIALAKAEQKLGLPITDEQIKQLEDNANNINYDVAAKREKEVRHDVMAHVYAYGKQCPDASGIIHLGATSCYVGDNTDIIIMKEAMEVVRRKLINVIANLSKFADEYKALPTLGYTHLQPAQLTTVGKRATLWLYEFLLDLEDIEHRISTIKLLGSKGTTGTQASFVELFEGDTDKIDELERLISKEIGIDGVVPVSGQTYSRKVDAQILSMLVELHNGKQISHDMRILQSFKEMEEPFEKSQIGSSAMPYKRNPMRCERISALSRYVIINSINPSFTAATQWFERTLDDSANKRISVAEAFLAVDSIMNIMLSVTDGLVVYPKVIEQRLGNELPFMATENIMMQAVKKGGNRQELHEKLRSHSIEAARLVKEQGLENDLVERISADKDFMLSKEEIEEILKPENFVGRSIEQVERFLSSYILPILDDNKNILGENADLSV